MMTAASEGLLVPYRILDLTNKRGFICGKLLGDLGADVIKIEKPGGDPARSLGPFYHGEPDPEKSLFWWGYNVNKRGVTLDIEATAGREIFRKLVKTADIILESFDPGYMTGLGLGFSDLKRINPGIIMASISSFGQTGPYKDYKASDLTLWSMAGIGYVTGDSDRAPLMPSYPIGYYFAAMSAAIGILVALYQRAVTGNGQHVDAPALLGLAWPSGAEVQGLWEVERTIVKRSGGIWRRAQRKSNSSDLTYIDIPIIYPCKDGSVRFVPFVELGMLPSTIGMTEWVIEEGMANEALKKVDWRKWDWQTVSQEEVDETLGSIGNFFLKHTKSELWEGAQMKGIQLYPILTPKDMLDFQQLHARDYWEEVVHPELNRTVTYPGPFIKLSEAPCRTRHRAPLIGEHNLLIYEGELGFSKEKIEDLKQAGII
jgi:crotonobetainyl-CoA:carnitine CoA-transferase CaiB-like acyl-CoA transferase